MQGIFAQKKVLWDHFQRTGKILPEVRPMIAASWLRCQKLQIDVQSPVPQILSDSEFKEIGQKNQALIDVSKPCIDNLYTLVEDSNNMITLHDRAGHMLYYICCEEYYNQVNGNNHFCLGVRWEESTIGTNGVSLCMLEDAPIQVYGAEHYCFRQHPHTCSAAPIHDNDGNIIGCLNMSGRNTTSNLHALGMIAAAAYAIENLYALYNSYNLINSTFSMIFEGLIVLNSALKIVRTSKRISKMFLINANELVGQHISFILPSRDFQTKLANAHYPFSDMEQDFVFNDKLVSCNVSVTPIISKDMLSGIILLLRKTEEINKIANEVSGNKARYTFNSIITQDQDMCRIMRTMKDVASTQCTILIEGESGTGKELFAHAIHNSSNRVKGPFIAVNCASLPHSLVESELFGYERGAFTGALNTGNPGKFELANGGTIFLDEIGELPLEIQAKLLRVLDTHRISRIGGKTEKELNVRVIAATNRNLLKEIENYRFRADLYYRINVLTFFIPPLRSRKGDIPLLAEYFIQGLNHGPDGLPTPKRISPACINCLDGYDWPGNVRELQNAMICAYYCSGGSRTIEVEHLSQNAVGNRIRQFTLSGPESISQEAKNEYTLDQRENLIRILKEADYNVAVAAATLKINRATLYRRLDRFRINLKDYRRQSNVIREDS